VCSELGKVGGCLRAKVETEEDKKTPPVQGWQYADGGKWQSDPTLEASRQVSKPCSEVLVELHGAAKEKQPECAGIYRPMKGWHNRGRWVLQNTSSKKERYLTVRTGHTVWMISDDIDGENGFIQSGSAGGLCPADPTTGISPRLGYTSWMYGPTSFRTISVISVIVTRFSVSHPFLKLLWGKLGRLTRDVAVARKITIRCVLYV